MSIYELVKKDKLSDARYGFISLRGKKYETPMFASWYSSNSKRHDT